MLKKGVEGIEGVQQKREFYCEKCDYKCSTKFLFKQHLSTKKHKGFDPAHIMLKCVCGRSYRHVQSYKRHLKSCKIHTSHKNTISNDEIAKGQSETKKIPFVGEARDTEIGATATEAALAEACSKKVIDDEKRELHTIIKGLMDQNRTIIQENQKMQSVVRDMLPKIGNNNTTFNLQVFLNEKCKDAINLSEFVESLKLETSDLEKTRELGYAGGVANILVRGLQQMEIHRRPIHCSDLQRETLFVRDKDVWEQGEDGRGHLQAAISTVAQRQTGKIKEWEAQNPGWNQTDEGTNRYIEMVRSLTDREEGGNTDREIIRSIAREVDIGAAKNIIQG